MIARPMRAPSEPYAQGKVTLLRLISQSVKEGTEKLPSEEELAKLVGVRRETIGNLEKGRYNPSLVLAWNIAKVFGVPIEEVFTVEPDGPAEHS